ncbi:ribosome small subunit-dependent GTPase A [Vibrio sp. 10N.286.49.C2]|uniref:ribosome small subunit-dependent GTPase A n=1 Tax=unclassified Vibrio TaxID=2614977 RepID=UPI000C8195C5|nr:MULTISPECIES: ribosome small subunit-dependent GTPase A [unclassified Vibrio]PMH35209.1 ribosome small subunit-dependent GTPase A [Vibrio sp. 10N.286.49.C2]PMH57152.1 ribosome small subunit-dependent GTPase A [Vibrio sp. 10N.286.49.B1]PMH82336.1 ribosome small subunit-dependent GTPase A [Vibrio sp. 10N.286.48.B7]
MNSIFTHPISLNELGWKSFFQQQLTLDEYEGIVIGRVIAHHRSGYIVCTEDEEFHMEHHSQHPTMTVGDWVLLHEDQRFLRALDRKSLFSRKAPGSKIEEQYIAANVDTVFIVCSLNDDFNLSRIERYLTLVNESQAEAVIVLTKADLCDDADKKRQQVQALDAFLMIEMVNALDSDTLNGLKSWCGNGQTVAFMGSSGVGKSTLVNSLMATQAQATGGIREDDSKGRHTTTSRSIHKMMDGGLLLDTPGMREIQLTASEDGLAETFSDVEALITQCRFSDCQHNNEPGCAVRQALEAGTIETRRLDNYYKLLREQAHNSASLAERRSTDKQFGKFIRSVQTESRGRKKGY